MAVAFVTSWALSAGNASSGSFATASFTPTNNGDALPAFILDLTSFSTLSAAGTGTWGKVSPPGDWQDGTHTFTPFVNSNSANSSQTITVTGEGATDFMIVWPLEYSGVSSNSGSAVTRVTPGAGADAITGNSVTVASGSVLVALCYETSGGSGSLTSSSGTNRNNGALGVSYCITEWAGSGGSITPVFTGADGATATYDIVQVLLSGAASAVLMGQACL
jgi:hypothetical protein